ncbi:MAG: hypothetical protein H0T52_11320 [Lautropia sp.]|nr:hypothetical protein [Lautropia sp.]
MRAVALAALLLLGGCGGTGSNDPPATVAASAVEKKTTPSTQVETLVLDNLLLAFDKIPSISSRDGLDANEIKSVQSAFDKIGDEASKL